LVIALFVDLPPRRESSESEISEDFIYLVSDCRVLSKFSNFHQPKFPSLEGLGEVSRF